MMSRDDDEAGGKAAMGQWDASSSRCGHCRRDALDYLEGDAGRSERQTLLGAATQYVGVATF
jgi:hypothetical protein